MFLYDKKENFIDIYCLTPDDKKLSDYRIEQMKQIPEEETILRGVTGIGIEGYEIFENYQSRFDTELIPIENVNGKYHKLEPDTFLNNGKNKEILLDSYYFGHLKDRKIARIRDLKKLRYLLLFNERYARLMFSEKKVLEGIIEIPESLYLLSLIEQEKFSLIGDNDISEQLNLFTFEQTKGLDLETIETMDNMGIAPGWYLNTLKKTENDAHILKLLKK